MTDSAREWRKCSACRKTIDFGATCYNCSVSTCQRTRTSVVFCSVQCWQAHDASVRHRDAWAEEASAPSKVEWLETQREAEASSAPKPGRRVVDTAPRQASPGPPTRSAEGSEQETDVLVVVSKLKKYIRGRSGMNTSDGVVRVLSDHLRDLSTAAIRVAASDERRTVMDRDFAKVLAERYKSS